jgi:hypothetical protein
MRRSAGENLRREAARRGGGGGRSFASVEAASWRRTEWGGERGGFTAGFLGASYCVAKWAFLGPNGLYTAHYELTGGGSRLRHGSAFPTLLDVSPAAVEGDRRLPTAASGRFGSSTLLALPYSSLPPPDYLSCSYLVIRLASPGIVVLIRGLVSSCSRVRRQKARLLRCSPGSLSSERGSCARPELVGTIFFLSPFSSYVATIYLPIRLSFDTCH